MPVIPLLGLLYVGLKLSGYIAWSWLWVLAPFYIGAVVALLTVILFIAGSVWVHTRQERRCYMAVRNMRRRFRT